MNAMNTQVRESMAALRRIIAGLRTPGLKNCPLRQAPMEHCVAVNQRIGIHVTRRIDPAINRLPPVLAETSSMIA